MFKLLKNRFTQSLSIGCALALVSQATSAIDYNYDYGSGSGSESSINNYSQTAAITLFEHCNFGGKRTSLSIGDFASMKKMEVGNDRVSSIQISQGITATLFKHRDFNGSAIKINRNIACLNKDVNDSVSSIKVHFSHNVNNSNNNGNYSTNQRYGKPYVPQNSIVTGYNVKLISFSDSRLMKQNNGTWLFTGNNKQAQTYTEIDRNQNSLLLKNNHDAVKLNANFQSKTVSYILSNGQQFDMPLLHASSQSFSGLVQQTKINHTAYTSPSRRIQQNCFTYRAYTNGGQGGIRFHGKDGFKTFSKRGTKARICHNGALTMEINKTDMNTTVFVDIANKTFKFSAHESADAYKNTWYRKRITLVVGK